MSVTLIVCIENAMSFVIKENLRLSLRYQVLRHYLNGVLGSEQTRGDIQTLLWRSWDG